MTTNVSEWAKFSICVIIIHVTAVFFCQSVLAEKIGNLRRQVELKIPTKCANPTAVVYGNKTYGYFSEKIETQTQVASVNFDLLPPGYVKSIEFYVQNADNLCLVHHETFKNPFSPKVLTLTSHVENGSRLSAPYLFLTGSHPTDNGGAQHFPYIVNSVGEVIWAQYLDEGVTNFNYHLVFHPVGPDQFAAISYRQQSFLEIFSSDGSMLRRTNPQKAKDPYVTHHDFLVKPDLNSMLTLGHDIRQVRFMFPIFQDGWKNLLNNLAIAMSSPLSFTLGTLIEVDLIKNKAKTIWNPIQHYDPNKTANKFNGQTVYKNNLTIREYQEIQTNGRNIWGNYNTETHLDWMHLNSLTKGVSDNIVLMSIRNFHEIIAWNIETQMLEWTLGCGDTASHDLTYSLRGTDCFFGQHAPSWIAKDRLLLFDNHASPAMNITDQPSRLVLYQLNKSKKEARLLSTYTPNPPILSLSRGSAHWIEAENQPARVIGFFPDESSTHDFAIEFDAESGAEIVRIKLNRATPSTGYRADPRFSLAKENFIGWEINRP